MRSMVEGAQNLASLSAAEARERAQGPLHRTSCGHEQVRSAPHCAAMSGGHGDLLIPRSGEDQRDLWRRLRRLRAGLDRDSGVAPSAMRRTRS